MVAHGSALRQGDLKWPSANGSGKTDRRGTRGRPVCRAPHGMRWGCGGPDGAAQVGRVHLREGVSGRPKSWWSLRTLRTRHFWRRGRNHGQRAVGICSFLSDPSPRLTAGHEATPQTVHPRRAQGSRFSQPASALSPPHPRSPIPRLLVPAFPYGDPNASEPPPSSARPPRLHPSPWRRSSGTEPSFAWAARHIVSGRTSKKSLCPLRNSHTPVLTRLLSTVPLLFL